jgi:Resolvase, N terminal domain
MKRAHSASTRTFCCVSQTCLTCDQTTSFTGTESPTRRIALGTGVDRSDHTVLAPTRRGHAIPAGKALFQIMRVFAEFERAMIRERVNAGCSELGANVYFPLLASWSGSREPTGLHSRCAQPSPYNPAGCVTPRSGHTGLRSYVRRRIAATKHAKIGFGRRSVVARPRRVASGPPFHCVLFIGGVRCFEREARIPLFLRGPSEELLA